MSKTKFLAGAFVLAICLSSAVALGILSFPDRGICFGKCANKREAQFKYFFESWYLSQFECSPQPKDRKIIQFVFPQMIERLDEANLAFAQLANSEREGTLSISDRDKYLQSDLRVIILGDDAALKFEEVSYKEMPTWIRECRHSGVSGGDYCEDYATIPVLPPSNSKRLNPLRSSLSKEGLIEEFYNRLVASGEIYAFNDMIVEDSRERTKLLMQAEKEVAAMPASTFADPSEKMYNIQVLAAKNKRYRELLCE